uniref:Putative secreted protein n=1 Tax=Amblyomma triste TaxID=251400 RepID=A0A023G1X8_AMBTT
MACLLTASLWSLYVTVLGIRNCPNIVLLPDCAALHLFAASRILPMANLPSGIDASGLDEVLLECCVNIGICLASLVHLSSLVLCHVHAVVSLKTSQAAQSIAAMLVL